MNMDWTMIIGYLITLVTGVVGWMVGTRQRKISAINEMQDTINKLAAKNSEYVEEMLSVKKELSIVRLENAELKKGQELMTKKLEELKTENMELNKLRSENEELKAKLKAGGYGGHQ